MHAHVSARGELHFLDKHIFAFQQTIEEKTFQPTPMFYKGNMKHWLSLISFKAAEVMFNSRQANLSFKFQRRFPSQSIFSMNIYSVTSTWGKIASGMKSLKLCIYYSMNVTVTTRWLEQYSTEFTADCTVEEMWKKK